MPVLGHRQQIKTEAMYFHWRIANQKYSKEERTRSRREGAQNTADLDLKSEIYVRLERRNLFHLLRVPVILVL